MFNLNEQFAASSKETVDTAMRFTQLALESTERLMKLQLDTVRNTLEENAKTIKAVAAVKDINELSAMRGKAAETLVERATAYSREVYEVASQAQTQMAKLAEETLTTYNEKVMSNIDSALKNAPAGADAAVNAFKSSMAVASEAVETFTKAAKQVTDITEANIKAAANTAAQNVKAAAKKAA
jgi:phasin family protein